jgi:hypothetical protein
LKLLQNNTKKLHRQADSSEDEAEQLQQQPTKKQMMILERLMLSMKRASERNKTNLLREEFVKMNR